MITVKKVSKGFQSGRGWINALNDISFCADAGRVFTIKGKSGSGKTTLLYCLGGLLRPDTGTITCDGIVLNHLRPKALSRFQRRRLGFIFQQGNLLSYYTVFDNIALPMLLNGVSAKERKKRVTFLLQRIGLSGAEKALPNELSGGEAQRVAAARAMAHFPQVLLADEPTASLDSETSRQLIQLLSELSKAQQCTLIFSTHDPELLQLADQCLSIKDGSITQEAP
jgi:putative ABC transport system ATP-binding protein